MVGAHIIWPCRHKEHIALHLGWGTGYTRAGDSLCQKPDGQRSTVMPVQQLTKELSKRERHSWGRWLAHQTYWFNRTEEEMRSSIFTISVQMICAIWSANHFQSSFEIAACESTRKAGASKGFAHYKTTFSACFQSKLFTTKSNASSKLTSNHPALQPHTH